MLATTKIFFERTTKTSHSLQALGNVYRNSKWSDLHVFNIKESSIMQFRSLLLLILVFTFLFILSWRFNFQWTTLLIFNLVELISYLKDFLTSWFLFFLYTISFSFLKLAWITTKQLNIDIIYSNKNYQKTTKSFGNFYKNINNTYNIKTTSSLNNELLISSLYLQKVLKYLHLVNISDTPLYELNKYNSNLINFCSIFQKDSKNLNYILYFNNKNRYNLIEHTHARFFDKDVLFYNCVKNTDLTNTHFYNLNYNIIRSLKFIHQKEFKNAINRNLNIGKENRWLMKNSLLSYDIFSKNLSTTHVKKLYGNIQFNSNSPNSNIWISNRLNTNSNFFNTSDKNNLQNYNIIKTNLLYKNSLLNLNNLEDSFFWIFKRFKFLQSTNTYYQFEHQNIKDYNQKLIKNERNSSRYNVDLFFFKDISVINASDSSLYRTHPHVSNIGSHFKYKFDNRLLSESASDFSMTNFDLNFSKYLLNNIMLQKNNIMIYSNI
jgi:hypothetical protein